MCRGLHRVCRRRRYFSVLTLCVVDEMGRVSHAVTQYCGTSDPGNRYQLSVWCSCRWDSEYSPRYSVLTLCVVDEMGRVSHAVTQYCGTSDPSNRYQLSVWCSCRWDTEYSPRYSVLTLCVVDEMGRVSHAVTQYCGTSDPGNRCQLSVWCSCRWDSEYSPRYSVLTLCVVDEMGRVSHAVTQYCGTSDPGNRCQSLSTVLVPPGTFVSEIQECSVSSQVNFQSDVLVDGTLEYSPRYSVLTLCVVDEMGRVSHAVTQYCGTSDPSNRCQSLSTVLVPPATFVSEIQECSV
ncbi:hypothetical protein J6590_067366 [Homalodisca vitripennis]|nr:hypothetical protein J6590_067366 [Homalodisca vitripennis]